MLKKLSLKKIKKPRKAGPRRVNFVKKGTAEKIAGEKLYRRINRDLENVGGARLFIFEVKTAEEFFSALAVLIGFLLLLIVVGISRGIDAKMLIIGATGFGITIYVNYQKPIDNFKDRLMKDNELPAIVNVLVQGLTVEMPIINIMKYIADNKKGTLRDIIQDAVDRINTGVPLDVSLQEAADKSMNKYFQRVVRILMKSKESPKGLAAQLQDVLTDIEEERLNTKLKRATILDNGLFFVVFIGYFIPLLAMILTPFISNMGVFGSIG